MHRTWQLGVTTLYVLKRMVTLISASFIYVGRIDVPFLSERADEIAGYQLDKFPFVFRKDMLLHEAHRCVLVQSVLSDIFMSVLTFSILRRPTKASVPRYPWANLHAEAKPQERLRLRGRILLAFDFRVCPYALAEKI